MELKIIYEDNNLIVVDKPAGLVVFSQKREDDLMSLLLPSFPLLKEMGKEKRYGLIHRLDKDTSGLLLVAKNEKALDFFQKQFQERKVKKKYLALLEGILKEKEGKVSFLIGRNLKKRIKQKIFLPLSPQGKGKREAITKYKVLQEYGREYSLLEVSPLTGRKHQIRATFSYLNHPVVGDKIYSFRHSPRPEGLERQFLHSFYLKIKLMTGKEKEFFSPLPEDLREVLEKLNEVFKKDSISA